MYPDHEKYAHQPDGAAMFTSRGNYGSTVFDTNGAGGFLQLNICDTCLLGRRDRISYVVSSRSVEHYYEPWDPDKHN